jgi:hypothetical protein
MKRSHVWIAGLTASLALAGLLTRSSSTGTAEAPNRARSFTPFVPGESASSPRVAKPGSRRDELLAETAAAVNLSEPDRTETLARICREWAGFDPRGAVERAIEWDLGDVPGLFENLALQWASHDLPSALAWAELQTTGSFRAELIARIAFAMAQEDPAAAANFLSREIDAGPEQDEAAISVLHQWALRDPAAAQAWAEAFPAGDLRERALQEVAGIMAYRGGESR